MTHLRIEHLDENHTVNPDLHIVSGNAEMCSDTGPRYSSTFQPSKACVVVTMTCRSRLCFLTEFEHG